MITLEEFQAKIMHFADNIDRMIGGLIDKERESIFMVLKHRYCFSCGRKELDLGPRCQCENDE